MEKQTNYSTRTVVVELAATATTPLVGEGGNVDAEKFVLIIFKPSRYHINQCVMSFLIKTRQYFQCRNALLFHRLFNTNPTARSSNNNTYNVATIMDMRPCDFVKLMKKNNTKRFFVVFDKALNCVKTSNHVFNDLKVFCGNDEVDYKQHEGFFLEIGQRTGALLGAFVWQTNRGQAVRFNYR